MTTSSQITLSRLAFVLRLCVLIGYPIVAMFSSVLPVPPSWLSIGFRLFVLIISIVVLVKSSRLFKPNIGFLLFSLFFGLLFIRIFYDLNVPGSHIGMRHILLLFGTVVLPVLAIMVHGLRGETDKPLAKSLTLFGLGMMLFMIATWATGRGYNAWAEFDGVINRLALSGLNPISVGSAGVVSLLASLTILTRLNLPRDWRVIGIATAFVSVLVIVLANSRGPIVAGTVAAMWLFFSNLRRGFWSLCLMAVAIGLVLLTSDLATQVSGRFSFDTVNNASNNLRLTSQLSALQSFAQNPVFGSFLVNPEMPPELYPHNLIIETAMAMGMVGLLFLGMILLACFFRVIQFYGSEHPLLTALMIHFFLLAQFSGTLIALDALFMLLALAATTVRQRNSAVVAPVARPRLIGPAAAFSRRSGGRLSPANPQPVAEHA